MLISRVPLRFMLLGVLLSLVGPFIAPSAVAQTVGVVADNSSRAVVVFDGDANVVLGSVILPSPGGAIGDCVVTADATTAFATDFTGVLWVIDLTTSPPTLAAGTNPIPISNYGEDLSITPDQKYIVVSDGGAFQPISVVDIANRVQIGTFALPSDCNSVEVCSDGSVLATSSASWNVHRLTIDQNGNLTDTGEILFSGSEPNNVFCAPGAGSGIVITRGAGEIRSFTIPGLALVSARPLSAFGFGISGLVHPAGDRVFARSNPGAVDVFSFDSATAALGAAPLFTIPIAPTPTFYGMDQMALHPGGARLYVSQPGALNVYDATNGAFVASITDSNLIEPTGVSFAGAPFEPNQPPQCDSASALVAELWPPNHDFSPVTIVGVTDPDGDPVTITVTGVTQDEPLDDLGDGNTCADATIVDGAASVRSERSGRGNGRVYAISFLAADGQGGACQGTVNVCVPHDQRGRPCVDDGQIVNSLGACDSVGIKLLSPSLAEVVTPGQPYKVRYEIPSGQPADRVGLLYSLDHGTGWYLHLRNQPNTGQIVWPVPAAQAESVLVAVAEVAVSETGAYEVLRVLGESDYFRIATPLAVTDGPVALRFAPIQPNPTTGTARMQFGLPRVAEVALEVFDAQGRKVKTVTSGVRQAGWHEVSWAGDTDAGGVAGAGLYFIRLRAEQQELTHRLVRNR